MTEQSWARRNIVWLILGGVFLVVLPVLACVGFGALYYVLRTSFPPPASPITQVFYYDIMTGKLFPGPLEEYPPIATPDKSVLANGSPAGVKANVFSCGKCDASQWHIGYVETYLPEAREIQIRMNQEMKKMSEQPAGSPSAMMGPTPQEMMLITEGHLVASPNDLTKWHKQESQEGMALVNTAMKKCPGSQYPQQCFPGQ